MLIHKKLFPNNKRYIFKNDTFLRTLMTFKIYNDIKIFLISCQGVYKPMKTIKLHLFGKAKIMTDIKQHL